MKISVRVIIYAALIAALGFAILIMAYISTLETNRARILSRESNTFVAQVVNLNVLTDEFVQKRDDASIRSWESQLQTIDESLDAFAENQADEGVLELRKTRNSIDSLFNQLVQSGRQSELEERVTQLLLKESEHMISEATTYNQKLFEDVYTSQVNNQYIATGIVAALLVTVVFLILYILLSVVSRIGVLTKFAEDVSSGKKDVVISEDLLDSHDEIGILSRQFQAMTVNLVNAVNRIEASSKEIVEQKLQLENSVNQLGKSKAATLNILEDVQESNQSLEQFKLAVENASDMIIISDKEGYILFANKATEKLTGFMPNEVVGKKPGKETWGGSMEKSFYETMWKTLYTDKQTFKAEVTNKRKDGSEYVADLTIYPILNQQKEVSFYVGVQRDITKAKEVDRMKTEFISLASHQLRTPLSAMKWFLEMLLSGDAGELNAEQKEYTSNIDKSNERMIALVNGLLNISRIESGRIIVEPEETDLKELIDGVVTEVQQKFNERKQTIAVSVHADLPKILVDPKLIRNVYLNLLTNANKYTPEGGEISVFVSRKGEDIVSQVTDNGYGIPKAEQDKLFKKFYRGSNITKTDTDGTGLGLYLLKSIIDSSGGKVWFESEEGKGTTFWFSIPMKGMIAKKGEVTLDS